MHNNAVHNQFVHVLVDYTVDGVMHHELRTVNRITGLDTRMSDYKFPNAQYPMTFVPCTSMQTYKHEIKRTKAHTECWACVLRKTNKTVATFTDFNDALEYVKAHN